MEKDIEEFVKDVLAAMQELGWNNVDLAKAANMSTTHIGRIVNSLETGEKINPTQHTQRKIRRALLISKNGEKVIDMNDVEVLKDHIESLKEQIRDLKSDKARLQAENDELKKDQGIGRKKTASVEQ